MLQLSITAHAQTNQIAPSVPEPKYYVMLPKNLITELRDSPVAIGVYALIARLFRIRREAIPLSAKDLMVYDPQVSYGSAARSIQRLIEGGWILQDRGYCKTRYIPTWGLINDVPRVWSREDQNLGRPRHVRIVKLDQTLFDVGLGRFEPSLRRTALVERYVETPPISLRTIGWYSMGIIGIRSGFRHLREIGLVNNNHLQPVPSEPEWLSGLSDPTKANPNQLTAAGYERLGVIIKPNVDNTGTHSVFFVPPSRIGSMIVEEIAAEIVPTSGYMIGQHGDMIITDNKNTASESDKIEKQSFDPEKVGSHAVMQESGIITQPPRERSTRSLAIEVPQISSSPKATLVVGEVKPVTLQTNPESVELLEKLHMRPAIIRELGTLDSRDIRAAMIDVENRAEIRDRNGWIIYLLRQLVRDGWAPWRLDPNYGMDKSKDPVVPVTSYAPILTHPGVDLDTRLKWIKKFSNALPLDRGSVIEEFLAKFPAKKER